MIVKRPTLTFITCLLIVLSVLSIGKYVHYKPSSIHQWAQSDRASIALNYYQEDMNFFLPRVHNVGNGTGITGLEFPIINYAAGVLYKLFGFDEFWYRLIELIIISFGLIFMFKLCNQHLRNMYNSIFIVLLFYLSPTLVYYSANFLPDLPSLGFMLIAWFYILKYKDSHKNKDILLFTIFASLSALIKITSLISIFAIVGVLILDTVGFFRRKEFENKIKIYLSILFVFISVFCWYRYSVYLNEKYQSWFFLMNIRPVESFDQLVETIKFVKLYWLHDYYDKSMVVMSIIGIIYLLLNFRKGNLLLNTITILLIIGDICFVLLMLFQFRDHDYYIITLLLPVIFLLLSISIILKEKEQNYSLSFNFLLFVLVITNLLYCKSNINERFNFTRNRNYYSNIEFYDKLKNINTELKNRGISFDKKFTVLYDVAPNNVLYIINQKGYAVESGWYDEDLIKYFNKSDYVLIENIHINDRPMFQKYFVNKILDIDGVSVFKLN